MELVGEPLAFGQPSMEVLAVSAPDRTGEPTPRIFVRPHSARPCPTLQLSLRHNKSPQFWHSRAKTLPGGFGAVSDTMEL